jgi:hypothetical protein
LLRDPVDAAFVDAEGYVFPKDIEDVIISCSFNFGLAEVEKALDNHSSLRAAGVSPGADRQLERGRLRRDRADEGHAVDDRAP